MRLPISRCRLPTESFKKFRRRPPAAHRSSKPVPQLARQSECVYASGIDGADASPSRRSCNARRRHETGCAACGKAARQCDRFAQEKLTVFYYEQFFSTALNGIDRANIMPVTIQIAQVILLISFLVAVYESFIRGADVRMLGVAAVKYVGLGLVLLIYATVFRDINGMFSAFADFIANNMTGGTDVFKIWLADLRDHFNQFGYRAFFDLVAGGFAGLIGSIFIIVSYLIYPDRK